MWRRRTRVEMRTVDDFANALALVSFLTGLNWQIEMMKEAKIRLSFRCALVFMNPTLRSDGETLRESTAKVWQLFKSEQLSQTQVGP